MFLTTLIAKWETKGKDFLELYRQETDGEISGYTVSGRNQGGVISAKTDQQAMIDLTEYYVLPLKADRPSLKLTYYGGSRQ